VGGWHLCRCRARRGQAVHCNQRDPDGNVRLQLCGECLLLRRTCRLGRDKCDLGWDSRGLYLDADAPELDPRGRPSFAVEALWSFCWLAESRDLDQQRPECHYAFGYRVCCLLCSNRKARRDHLQSGCEGCCLPPGRRTCYCRRCK